MRRVIKRAMVVWLAAVCLLPGAAATAQVTHVQVTVAGVPFTGAPAPQLTDGITWGPIAPICALLGAEVEHRSAERCELVGAGGQRIVVQAGRAEFHVNGRPQPLAVPPVAAGGELIAPLKPVLEALGARVRYSPSPPRFVAYLPLESMQWRGGEEGLALELTAPAPVQGEVHYLSDPPRAYVDLPGLELPNPVGRQYLGAAGVIRARWSQFEKDPPIVRVTLDLAEGVEARWVPGRQGGSLQVGEVTGREPRFVAELPRLEQVLRHGEPGRNEELILRFSRPVDLEYDMQRDPYRLRLSIPDAVGEHGTRAPDSPRPLLGPVWIGPLLREPGLLVEVHLNWLMRFELNTRAGGREVRLAMERGALAGKRIVLDPGHGGRDPGACSGGLQEKNLNLEVALTLASQLAQAGAIPVLTRDRDVFVELAERPGVADSAQADVFVSIHHNAMPRPNANHGTETYHWTPQSAMLAQVLQKALVQGLGRRDNGVRQRKFAVLWRSQRPCALVEIMYMDHDQERRLLAKPETRRRAAQALLDGLRGYFEGVPLY